jgi:hypothetical protein
VVEAKSVSGQDAPRRAEGKSRVMQRTATETRMPLRRLACARCGGTFDCGGGAGGCWCMGEGFRLPMPGAAGEDCLCPACLRTAAASAAGRPA